MICKEKPSTVKKENIVKYALTIRFAYDWLANV